MNLNIKTTINPNYIEFNLSGKVLSDEDVKYLNTEVDIAIENKIVNFILNLEGLEIINSMGLNCFIKIFTKARNNNGEMYIVNISDKINQVLLLTKLNSVLNIATSLEEARNKF